MKEKESQLSSLRKNNIEPEFCPVNALCKHPDEKELMKLCVLYNDLIDYVRNKDAKDSDNSIATDNYLFERTMQKSLDGRNRWSGIIKEKWSRASLICRCNSEKKRRQV